MPAGLSTWSAVKFSQVSPVTCLDQLAGDHVQNIVVGIAAAEAGRRLDVAQPPHRFRAAEVGARHEQQIAGAEAEAAAMHEQVADGHLARDPRVVHLETRAGDR